jgi:CBS domain containing-hemolysin-like protein
MTAAAIVLLVIGALIAVNGIYVAAEFAIIGVRATRLRALAEDGSTAAATLLNVISTPRNIDQYLSTTQVGITLASLGLGMYGEVKLAGLLLPALEGLGRLAPVAAHGLASVLAVGILTYLHVVLGEMVPKTMTLSNPESVAFRLAELMRVSRTAFGLLVAPLALFGRLVLRALRIPEPSAGERILSAEELGLVISQSAAGGLLTERAGQIMLRIFDFGEREVHQVMTPRTRVDAVPVHLDQAALEEVLVSSTHTRLPVFDGDIDHIVGALHVKDFVRWRLADETPYNLPRLARPTRVVPEHMSVERLLDMFKEEHGHFAVVIDEYGGTAGVVTLEDLAEEIVGEVQDEFDVEIPPIRSVGAAVLEVRGDVQLEDLEAYGPLPDDRPDVDTVGGLVVTLLGRPATPGDRVTLGAVHLRVLAVRGHGVELVRVRFQTEP